LHPIPNHPTLKVFITGATGLFGREMTVRLLESGYQVSALCRNPASDRVRNFPRSAEVEWIEGDIGDLLALQNAIQEADFVIHAAALVSFDSRDRKKLYHINVEGTSNMVNVSLLSEKLQKFIHISSVASLSPSKPMPTEIDERQGFNPDDSTSDYAWSKYNAELEVVRGVEEGLKAVMVNPSIILSPGNKDESSAGLFGYVMKEKPFYPTGWINYVDVRDVVSVVMELLKRGPEKGEKFLLSAGHIPYQSFFEKIAGVAGKRAPFIRSRNWMTGLAWRLEFILSLFTGKKPLLTKFTAASSSKRLIYKGKALADFWPDFRFRTLEETIQWVVGKKE
jgi:dihydroflavonol-4-reductase